MQTPAPESLTFAVFMGGWEIVLILAVFIILLGAKRLPRIVRVLGEAASHFLKEMRRLPGELDQNAHDAGKSIGGIYGKPAAQALTPDNQTAELYDPAVFRNPERIDRVTKRMKHRLWSRLLHVIWRFFSRT